jgi:hypothetical protein
MAEVAQPPQAGPVPAYVEAMQAVFGGPSVEAYGTTVYFIPEATTGALAADAQAAYQEFVGHLWEEYGEDAWLGGWQEVYTRGEGAPGDILAELRAIEGRTAAGAVERILDASDNSAEAATALAAGFDGPAVSDLAVYEIGDGEAMSGIAVAGRRLNGETTVFMFLMD